MKTSFWNWTSPLLSVRNIPTTCPPTPEKVECLCFLGLHPFLSLLAVSAGFPEYFLWENTFPSVLPSWYWGHTICCFVQVLISPVFDVYNSYLPMISNVFNNRCCFLSLWQSEIACMSSRDKANKGCLWLRQSLLDKCFLPPPGWDRISNWVGHLMLLEGAKAILCSPRAVHARWQVHSPHCLTRAELFGCLSSPWSPGLTLKVTFRAFCTHAGAQLWQTHFPDPKGTRHTPITSLTTWSASIAVSGLLPVPNLLLSYKDQLELSINNHIRYPHIPPELWFSLTWSWWA